MAKLSQRTIDRQEKQWLKFSNYCGEYGTLKLVDS